VLVVEDDSDGRAFQALLAPLYPSVTVDWLPANGIGNIKRKGSALIDLAKDRVLEGKGCVAVVIDGDGRDPSRDEPHASIQKLCRAAKIPLVLCREAMEALFLADPGCCRWMGIPLPPRSDTMSDPKARVAEAFLNKTRRTYQRRRARMEVARQASGPEGRRNGSLHSAQALLRQCGQQSSK
jgi:hypothetical protein